MCCNHIVLTDISRWKIRDSYDQRYCFVERYNRVFSDLSDKLGKLMDPSLNGNTQEGNLEKMAIYYNFRNNKTQNFRSYKMIKRNWLVQFIYKFFPRQPTACEVEHAYSSYKDWRTCKSANNRNCEIKIYQSSNVS